MKTGTLSIDGCDLAHEEVGSGPPVLLVHGAGAYAGLFRPCAELLAPSHRVVSYDRRGCSRSMHAPVRRMGIHVDDAAHLIREHIGEPVTVVGWSAGAVIALRLAMSHAELVTALVLAEPPLQLQAPRPYALGALARWEFTYLRHGPEAGARVFYRWVSQYRGQGGRNAFDAYPEEWQNEMLANAGALFAELRLGGGALGEGVSRARLSAIQVPMQVLLGESSVRVFEPAARYLVRVATHATLVPVADASHMVPTDRPDIVAKAVEAVPRVG